MARGNSTNDGVLEHTTEKKTRKTPVPQGSDRITQGALKLPLEERVKLRNDLTDSIDNELKAMEDSYNSAKKLIAGQQ